MCGLPDTHRSFNTAFLPPLSAGWRDIDGRAPRQRGQKEALDQLLGQIKEAHRHCVCHGINNFLIDLVGVFT